MGPLDAWKNISNINGAAKVSFRLTGRLFLFLKTRRKGTLRFYETQRDRCN